MSPICKKENHDEHAVAKRYSAGQGLPGDCVSSGNECTQEGPAYVGFYCVAMCPGETKLVRFSACAVTLGDAWSFAPDVCKGAEAPSASCRGAS